MHNNVVIAILVIAAIIIALLAYAALTIWYTQVIAKIAQMRMINTCAATTEAVPVVEVIAA